MPGNVPQVSIVVIFYNAERFLLSALESVRSQTFNSWELLLVDDGSSDESAAVARSFIDSCDKPARLLSHLGNRHRGMSASRNVGARAAQGAYLTFLDADDIWLPGKLEEQVALLADKSRADAVIGRTIYWSSWPYSETPTADDVVSDHTFPSGSIIAPPHLLRKLYPLGRISAPSMSNIMMRRSAYDAIGGFEEEFTGFYEDQAFLAKMYLYCNVMFANNLWDLYRQHSDSCSAVVHRTGRYMELRRRYLEWLEQYLKDENVQDRTVNHLLTVALRRERHPVIYRILRTKEIVFKYMFELTRKAARLWLPENMRRSVWRRIRRLALWPPVGCVRFGSFRRLDPISSNWGEDRGKPIDRFYIERFLSKAAGDIYGAVLELQDDCYTRRFGGDRVDKSEVLSVAPGNPLATLIANLEDGQNIADASYDCVIVTQTLQLIYDYRGAIRTLYRILRPGGIALVTVPGISKIDRDDAEGWSSQWNFTKQSAARAFEEIFGRENVVVESHGNVLAAISFLHGLAIGEVSEMELEYQDDDFPVIVEIRAQKKNVQ